MTGRNTLAGVLFTAAVAVTVPGSGPRVAAQPPAGCAACAAPAQAGASTRGQVVRLGYQLAAQPPYRWSGAQDSCLNFLWTRESGWRWDAANPGSGAYGIPQSLPAGKMASAGADWRTDPATQIRWGLGYIKGRYGTPCGAWAHEQAHDWY